MGPAMPVLLLLVRPRVHASLHRSRSRCKPALRPLSPPGPEGLPASERGAEAARLLEDVRLGEAAGVRAGVYSGGMKRRLSVAIALLGDPQARALLGVVGACVGSRRAGGRLCARTVMPTS